jgi:Kef-type K+ transport system membrane component KefB
MSGPHGSWLLGTLVYLAAAVIAVPLARLAGLSAIIGYLVAGILIGPWGLAIVSDPGEILHFAEFGVVLMLFLVGLELEPRRLWSLRRPIFGWGSVQLFGSALLMAAAGVLAGVDWRLSTVAGLGLAMSIHGNPGGRACRAQPRRDDFGPEHPPASRCCRTSPRSRSSLRSRCWPAGPMR